MNKYLIIAEKELKATFHSPVAYIILVVTITVFNIFFFIIVDGNREATLRDMFTVMEFMFIFIVPLLTMKAFAQEKEAGTIEFLQTTPTTNHEIVMGKYLGSLIFFTLIVSINILYYFILELFGEPDKTATLIGFLGLWLEGAMFIGIGLLASSLTRSQVIAAMTSYVALFLLYFMLSFTPYAKGILLVFVEAMGVMTHSSNLFSGLVSASDLVYFLLGILLSLFLARKFLENR